VYTHEGSNVPTQGKKEKEKEKILVATKRRRPEFAINKTLKR
jgi:hypothetical protein